MHESVRNVISATLTAVFLGLVPAHAGATDEPAPADYSKIDAASVLGWGNTHTSIPEYAQFENSLEELRQYGVSYVGMEIFPEDLQPTINAYFQSKKRDEDDESLLKIQESLENLWHPGVPNETEIKMSLMDVVKRIKATPGLQMLALEPAGLKMDLTKPLPTDPNNPLYHRDSNWVKVIQQILAQDRNAKIVVFAGTGHFTAAPEQPWTVKLLGEANPPIRFAILREPSDAKEKAQSLLKSGIPSPPP
jgi:hypothetical protein